MRSLWRRSWSCPWSSSLAAAAWQLLKQLLRPWLLSQSLFPPSRLRYVPGSVLDECFPSAENHHVMENAFEHSLCCKWQFTQASVGAMNPALVDARLCHYLQGPSQKKQACTTTARLALVVTKALRMRQFDELIPQFLPRRSALASANCFRSC